MCCGVFSEWFDVGWCCMCVDLIWVDARFCCAGLVVYVSGDDEV